MALKGQLRDYSLEQLLNLVHLAHKSGVLTIQSLEGEAELAFQEGKLVHAAVEGHPGTLLDRMVHAGKLTRSRVDVYAIESQQQDDRQIGLFLISAGLATKDEIVQVVRDSIVEAVYQLFDWEDGSFNFVQQESAPAGKILVLVELESLILEGSRRRQELAELRKALPERDLPVRFVEQPDARMHTITMSMTEWRVISLINSHRTISDIAREAQVSESIVRRMVARFVRDGLLEVDLATEPATGAAPGEPARDAKPPEPHATPEPADLKRRLLSRLRGQS
jgi:hypothetical protein